MLRQIEGSRAVAEAVALCRPEVICAYPISPQTHIVEKLSQLVKSGELAPCEFINVESEFAAMSVSIGASATGARAYTATASQGLLYMAEALYNASGLGLPIVMTVANRAIGAPINIWNDHSDSMSLRDSGWIQLYAETNQEALDLHIQAFRLAEELSTPVMVCMDGFILTHAVERVDIPDAGAGRRVPAAVSSRARCSTPTSRSRSARWSGPEAFTEVRYLAHAKQMQALELIPQIAAEFERAFGRDSGGLIDRYRARGRGDDRRRARLGARDDQGRGRRAARAGREDRRRRRSRRSGRSRSRRCARRSVSAKRVVVLEKALAVGIGGIVSANVRMALAGHRAARLHGDRRARRPADHQGLAARAVRRRGRPTALEPLTFLDLRLGRRRTASSSAIGAIAAPPARTPRTSCATSAPSAAGPV